MGKYFSKVLLFGEYGIICGHKALAVPYELFSGVLKFSSTYQQKESNKELKAFLHYLKKSDANKFLDLKSLEFDINQGLYFESTIPRGHGLGSSGALCANVYDRYCKTKKDRSSDFTTKDILELKEILAIMESHFHGSSSGIDPLLSYLSAPIMINGEEVLQKIQVPKFNGTGERALFLLDTGRSRRTEPLVHLFLEKLKSKDFEDLFNTTFKEINDNCINSFMEKDVENFYENFYQLSKIQKEHFLPMIPKLYQNIWQDGLESGNFLLKLCGAGGGGFILGVARDFDKFVERYPEEQVRVLYRF
jgi:mevalonate kinase